MSSTAVGLKLAGPVNEKYRAQWELVQKAKAGDQQAWTQVIESVTEMLKRVIWKMTRDVDLSKDLTQDSILRMFQKIDQWQGAASLKTWAHTIAVTIVLMHRRKESVRREVQLEDKELRDKHLDQVGLRLDIGRLMLQVPPVQRRLLIRHYLYEEQVQDIADDEGLTIYVVKSHLFRGRRGLRELFEHQKEML